MTAAAPAVSIIVVPRERFSCTEASLESIYANTPPIFELLFVDAGSPSHVRQYLESAAPRYGFRLLHAAWGISPNRARNLGVAHASGRYIVFIDNDVQVAPGWLQALVACADETQAGIVSPLVYLGEFEQRVIHMAGGELSWETRDGQRWLNESHRHFNMPLAQAGMAFRREPCGYAEFHCMLVRKTVLDTVASTPGPLDEQLLGVAEHIDLSLRSSAAGHPVWFEPAAQVAFLARRPAALCDIAYARLRWSHDWTVRSCEHFAHRWQLHPGCPAVAGARNFGFNHLAALHFPDEPALVDGFCAQTNIQLYAQCRALHYSQAQLALLRRTDEYLQRWFGHLVRASGGAFAGHAIGCASLLAAHGVAPRYVAAAMLHAAYFPGNQVADGKGISDTQRQELASLITPAGEYVVYLYATVNWKAANIGDLLANAGQLILPMGMAILIRLAIDLEEHVSHSTPNHPLAADMRRRWLPLYVEVANLLGLPRLANRVQKTVAEDPGHSAPKLLQAPNQESNSISQIRGV